MCEARGAENYSWLLAYTENTGSKGHTPSDSQNTRTKLHRTKYTEKYTIEHTENKNVKTHKNAKSHKINQRKTQNVHENNST